MKVRAKDFRGIEISWEIYSGVSILIGEHGSGKTRLLNMIGTFRDALFLDRATTGIDASISTLGGCTLSLTDGKLSATCDGLDTNVETWTASHIWLSSAMRTFQYVGQERHGGMAIRDGEFPWVVDQFNRCFPSGPGREFLEQGRVLPEKMTTAQKLCLSYLWALARSTAGSVVALDDVNLHPSSSRTLIEICREISADRTIIIATQSHAVMDEFRSEPGRVFVTRKHCGEFPTALDRLHDREWLAHFSIGDLYDRGEI